MTYQLNWKKRLGIAAVNGAIFMLLCGLFHYISREEIYEWKGLVFQGVFFGTSMALVFPFIFWKFVGKSDKNIYPELEPGEVLDTEGPANLFSGFEAVGGRLFLTNKKLIFNSHKFNIQTSLTAIEYQFISDVQAKKTGRMVANGLRIKTVEGSEYDFVVSNRDIWVEKIEEKLKGSS
ncbi:GRAM domain-containing protein [Algoriphagus sp. NG3]|uniref:GRAM domain-containing protein n=1 Tax=Algoriphagus sp. NG3 TaxID=3097546 RepID=UPI002A8105BA|nr:GRAM domain-containing protein [Algoriphagus sp. NG3]WPR73592.1 GRAM domain-containing protein [Algoriphagus sp. NG3]